MSEDVELVVTRRGQSLWLLLRQSPFPGNPGADDFNLELAAWDSEAAGVVDGILRAGDPVDLSQIQDLRARLLVVRAASQAERDYVTSWKALLDEILSGRFG